MISSSSILALKNSKIFHSLNENWTMNDHKQDSRMISKQFIIRKKHDVLSINETTFLKNVKVCIIESSKKDYASRSTNNVWSKRDVKQIELLNVKESSESFSIMNIVKRFSFACRNVKHVCDVENNCFLIKKFRNLLLDVWDLRDKSFKIRLKNNTKKCSVLKRCFIIFS